MLFKQFFATFYSYYVLPCNPVPSFSKLFFKKCQKIVRTVRLKRAGKPNKLIAQGIVLGYNGMNTNVVYWLPDKDYPSHPLSAFPLNACGRREAMTIKV